MSINIYCRSVSAALGGLLAELKCVIFDRTAVSFRDKTFTASVKKLIIK